VSLKQQVMSGLAWSVASKLITQVFSWVSTFFVIRMLTPEDYGLMAIAAVFFMLVTMFTTNGLSSALVNEQKRSPRASNLIFTFSIAVNLVLTAGIYISAPYIAEWYENESLTAVLWTMAAISPLSSFIVVPAAHLQMEMRFKEKALIESVSMLCSAVTAISLAYYLEQGYWALVYSTVVLTVSRAIGFNLVSKSYYRPTFDFSGAKPIYSFAWNMQMGSLVWFVYTRADTIILGKFLGLEKAGIYNVANEVASIPMNKVMMIMNDVAFAAFNKVKSDIEAAKIYLQKALRLMAIVAFPVFYGISAVSDEIVYVLLGEKWIQAGPIIALFALIIPFRMINILLNNFISGMGETKFGFYNALITGFFLISSLFIGAPYGLEVAAKSWTIGYVIALFIMYSRFINKFKLTWGFFKVILPTALLSAMMLVMLQWIQVLLSNNYDIEPWEMMLFKITAGSVSLGPVLYWLYHNEIKELLKR
jgi:teichuronic acid exporter